MNQKIVKIWALGALMTGASAPGVAMATTPATQDLGQITETARRFATANAGAAGLSSEIVIKPLDTRLQLAACDQTLQAFAPAGARTVGNTTVGIRCPGARTWTLYVPVQVKAMGQVLVASRGLTRGQALGADDFTVVLRDLASLPAGYVAIPEDALGKTAKRNIPAGSVISPSQLQAARVIRRGETVSILAHEGPLEVRMGGLALADGRPGELIRVRNVLTKKVLQGTVTPDGEIRVRL
jgi:flagella basal body P-ring formation protein FlgA